MACVFFFGWLPCLRAAAPLRIPDGTRATFVVVPPGQPELVGIAARLFADDLERLTGYRPAVVPQLGQAQGQAIVLGTVDSPEILRLGEKTAHTIETLRGRWESYAYFEATDEAAQGRRVFVVVGSDRRGVAYGALALSRGWGVSPWYWWADVPVPRRSFVEFPTETTISPSPAVKYRGIFINDEDWGLEPWAAHTVEPEVGTIGPKTYARVCELLLRLHANLLWPAMHDCTRAFYKVPGNKEVADAYGIVIGTSHAEPMLRNNVDEWDEKARGPFNYQTNRDQVLDYWRERVGQVSGTEAIYTLGMRGIHDSPMVGVTTMQEKIAAMEDVLAQQREMLHRASPDRQLPQVFVPYKEVLDAYDAGLRVPDDVTLMWTDDNFGYLRRLSDETERKRSGGSGVYYHVSYWGQPHDYLWLATTHPMHVWEEMTKAYESGADRIWVLNVGDIKPAEYLTQLFMDLAVSPASLSTPASIRAHLTTWCSEAFGEEQGAPIADALWEYYALAFERRPEHLGWNGVEPTTGTQPTAYNPFEYGDQIQRRLDRYAALEAKVRSVAAGLAPASQDAFFQLVQYPVAGAAAMNRKVLYREKAERYAHQHRFSANSFAKLAYAAQAQIAADTDVYNERISGGKWRSILSAAPRNLPIFASEPLPQWTFPGPAEWGVMAEGPVAERPDTEVFGKAREVTRARKLPTFTVGLPQQFYVDLFTSGPVDLGWKTAVSADWIRLSSAEGRFTPDSAGARQRIWVSIDPKRVPADARTNGTIRIEAGGRAAEVGVSVVRIPREAASAGTAVETNGYVAFDAVGYSEKRDEGTAPWHVLDGLGYSGKAVGTLPVAAGGAASAEPAEVARAAAYLEYRFFVVSGGEASMAVNCLPTLPIDRKHGMRFAVGLDGGAPVLVDIATQGRSPTWKKNVLSNQATARLPVLRLKPGEHRLRLYRVDPGIVFDTVTIDFGGLPSGCGRVPPTVIEGQP